ncbi:MAG: hypothetical protein WAM99_08320 [Xanthobacteraceae bacterium]
MSNSPAAEITVDAAGNEIDEGRRRAAIRHTRHFDLCHLQKQFRGEVRRAACAGIAHDALARMRFRVGDQLQDRFCRRGIRHEHEKRKLGDQGYRREIRLRIVAQRMIEADNRRQR